MVHDCPGHHENRFHVKQDEENCNQVKAHAESSARIANRLNAAFVGSQLGDSVAMPAHLRGAENHPHPKQDNGHNLHEKREILPGIIDHRRPVSKESVEIAPVRLNQLRSRANRTLV